MVLFTSSGTCAKLLPTSDLGLSNHEYTRDSLWIVLPELSRPAIGIARPVTLAGATVGGRLFERGMLTEERLRFQFLETVLLKAAARRPRTIFADVGDVNHG